MAVTVEIPSALSRFTDGAEQLQFEGQTVDEILQQLWQHYPKLRSRVFDARDKLYPYLLLTRNQAALSAEQLREESVTAGDTLEIVALAEGG